MSPFLVSVRCLIAARHLPDYRRLMVIPPLHILCREHAMSFVLSSTPNLASIQALHILSTWEPIESLTSAGHRLEVQDGGALIAAAIAHASALKLDVAAEFVHSCSESKDVPEHVAFKAKMVSRVLRSYDMANHSYEVVAHPVCFRVRVSYIHCTTERLREADDPLTGTASELGGLDCLVFNRSRLPSWMESTCQPPLPLAKFD